MATDRCDDACLMRRHTEHMKRQDKPYNVRMDGRVVRLTKINPKTDPDITIPHAGTPGFACTIHVTDPVL